MTKKLFIDMTECDKCEECTVKCAYFYRPDMAEHGIFTLREMAAFALICRRCEEPSCVASCRFDALERQDDGVLKRYNMRCVSCKCCSHGCPFGTIYPETVPYFMTNCDFCTALSGKAEPSCVFSCVKNAVEYREVEESEEESIYVLNENLAVRMPKWNKKDV